MSLKAIVEEVPENMNDYYTAREDGKFVLNVETVEGVGLEDVAGLKRSYEEVKAKALTRKQKLEAFGEYTPEQIKEFEQKALSAGKPNEAIDSLKNEYGQKLTEKEKAIQDLQAKIKEGNHRNAINSIFASNATGFKDGSADFAKQIMSKYIGTDEDGNTFIWNQDKTGARMSNKQGAWEQQMSPSEWLEGVKGAVLSQSSFDGIAGGDLKSFGLMLASNAKAGSGAGSPNAPSAGMTPEKWAGMNLTARTEWAKNNGGNPPKFN